MTTRMKERTKVFISYSHQDKEWLERLRIHLKPLEREYGVDIWDDRKIRAGSRWREEIKKAVASAKVAVLLISADFLASDFIATDELPPLLSAAEKEGAIILLVILSPSRFSRIPGLSIFQAVNDPSKPLITLTRGEQEALLVGVADSIEASLNLSPDVKTEQLRNHRTKARRITVECSDVADFHCDVLVLKYAQAFYGADSMVADRLRSDYKQRSDITPRPDEYTIVPSKGAIAAEQILFVGVGDVFQFEYEQIREFATLSMQILAHETPDAAHVAMTIHGVGYGLDEREAFSSQIAGLLDAFSDEHIPASLEQITIVERNQSRVERLRQILKEYLPSESRAADTFSIDNNQPASRIDSGLRSNNKPHIFVAMPFSEDMEDVYIFGIQGPVNSAGYLCERVDMATFTGDILVRIKSRIETAALVIADVTGANPNVYLEIGFAWGKERPTLLIAKKDEELKFDVVSQRCITYKSISDLAKKLEADLASLKEQS